MAETSLLLSVNDATVRFKGARRREPVVAVNELSLDIRRGETLCIVGESGSGKTTLAQVTTGLVKPNRGSVTFNGTSIVGLKGRRAKEFRRLVQVVFQDPYESLNPRQTVLQIMREPLDVHGVPADKAERARRVNETLEECGLSPAVEYLGRYPHELSGGQRQRVSIAAAAALRPALVVADEPVSMLDMSIRAGILQLLLDLKKLHGMTLVLITHDLSVAWAIADRVIVMYQGRIMESGPAEPLITSPWNPYTRALLSAVPDMSKAPRDRTVEVKTTTSAQSATHGCPFAPRCLFAVGQCLETQPTLEMVSDEHWSACIRQHELRESLCPVREISVER